jgi:hypothetical protein
MKISSTKEKSEHIKKFLKEEEHYYNRQIVNVTNIYIENTKRKREKQET